MTRVAASKIREELALAGWTQTRLANETGFTLKHINQICQAKVPLTPAVALAIGNALGVSPEFLMTLEVVEQLRELKNR